ncbi:MAG TPA: hypothetical protein PLF16_00530 [Candidatus Staskawiczbacteria bacterium]|nr:hypothetical protein [Candidatus Staskawiczbacteria bacterium]
MFIQTRQAKPLAWTEHSKIKMRQYGLSQQKILGILRKPERVEQAIVPGLVAVMKTNKIFFKEKKIDIKKALWQKKRAPGEIWVMYKENDQERKIVSAWRYPGISKPGDEIPIPEDIKLFAQSQI